MGLALQTSASCRPPKVSFIGKGSNQLVKVTREVLFVVKTGANTVVDAPIPLRMFQVSLKGLLHQLPDVVS